MNKRIENVLSILPKEFSLILEKIDTDILNELEEIRIRINAPVILITNSKEMILNNYIITKERIEQMIALITKNSVYTYFDDIKNGFITIYGGHRIGIGGTAIMDSSTILNIIDISYMNIRIAREMKNVCLPFINEIVTGSEVCNTLLISPPQGGKTTLLRDITRYISSNIPLSKVVVVDERGEIGAIYKGVPQNDLGLRTDVLSGYKKCVGMIQAIRSMSPTLLVTDEIGSKEDFQALNMAVNSGVKIITTVHGYSIDDVQNKKGFNDLLEKKVFKKIIILNSKCENRVERIINGDELCI